ncbi:MAG: SDR family oxidoreductase [Bacteroidales bacterium]|jgi:short-subunit dehydrogenase|nr:SDR family oxidoreductase [Bacteroidales bacterium]
MNIVITGASKGIGFEVARLFAAHEENTVVALARSENLLKELKNACIRENLKTKIRPLVFDIEDPHLVQRSVQQEILKYVDTVDILINNAGVLVNKPFHEISPEEMIKSFRINAISPALIIQELLPLLKRGQVKHVINIASMGGFQGSVKFPGLSIYSASKAALANLSEGLAEEYKKDQLTFNSLALGAVNTEMLRSAFPGIKAPLEPDDMARFICDFAIHGKKYFNGKVLPVSSTTP